ncbi:Mitotic spindle-associated MMXD complex subunit MIP18 [Apophysomyces sp. BC1034]|nr:Mitotic spindle-associated MMXD complex subunit MIP18 [Apophysomyces sp. BC1015]KAG0181638.1 Mitotic spindle-associated MMXD complex subunit MIP18 [Apophysomyces sp. BC1021]KAG0192304.1 Mitotic spindle-associated MMXD complex subunit MIP18 [Apophysomyces sp. BC1034]
MSQTLINANPTVYNLSKNSHRSDTVDAFDDSIDDPIDAQEVFDLIRSISDPEHPLTLEQLNVTQHEHIIVDDIRNRVEVEFTPTIPHCSMATLIGLCIRVRLLRSLPERFKVDIRVRKGTHQSEVAVNKQLNDKERVAAALENSHLLEVVNQCLATAGLRGHETINV